MKYLIQLDINNLIVSKTTAEDDFPTPENGVFVTKEIYLLAKIGFSKYINGSIQKYVPPGYITDPSDSENIIPTATFERDQVVAEVISLDAYRNIAIDLITEKFNTAYKSFLLLSCRYGDEEQKTWDLQSLRAREWLSFVTQPDQSISYAVVTESLRTNCACLGAIALKRFGEASDENVTTIAQYIDSKRIAFETEAGRLLGIIGAARDSINAAPIDATGKTIYLADGVTIDPGAAYDQIKMIVDSIIFDPDQ